MLELQEKNEISDVLWLQTAFIGDLVLTTAAFDLLARKKERIQQHVITTDSGAQIFSASPHIKNSYVVDKKKLSFFKDIFLLKKKLLAKGHNSKNTLLLQVHKSPRSSLLSVLLGFPTITYEESSFSFFADYRVPRVAVFHEAVRIALLLEPLGLSRQEILQARPKLKALDFAESLAWQEEIKAAKKPLVALACGSVWATKKWPFKSYLALAQKILAASEVSLCLLGSEAEEKEAGELERLCLEQESSFQGRIINLAGKTSLRDLCALYPKFSLLISNDSSAIHFASAYEIPTVAIFGPTVPEMGFSPLAPKSVVLEQKLLDCRPCHVHGLNSCPKRHFLCMRELSVEKVFSACQKRLV